MVSTHLKNTSQIGSFPQIGVNMKKMKLVAIVYEKEVYKILMDYIFCQTNSTDFCWMLVSKLDVYFPGNLEIWKVLSLLTKLVKHETAMVNLVIML